MQNFSISNRTISIISFVQFFAFVTLMIVDYYSIEYNNFDTGIFANNLSNFITQGKYYSNIIRTHALADHFSPNLILLSPLFLFCNSFLWLPFIKIIAFFSCILILSRICNRVLGENSAYTNFIIVLWLLNSCLQRTIQFEFQPSSLALPFILLAFLFAINKKYKSLIVCLVFILGFKEHLALIWIVLGVFLFVFENQKRFGLLIVVSGVILGTLIVTYIMPSFSVEHSYHHLHKFGPLVNLPEKISMIFKALSSVIFIPLLCPATLLFIIPAFAHSLLSAELVMTSLDFHYQDIGLTVIFVGLIYGFKQIESLNIFNKITFLKKPAFVYLLTLIFLIVNYKQIILIVPKHFPSQNDLLIIDRVSNLKENLIKIENFDTFWIQDSLGPYFHSSTNAKSIMNAKFLTTIKNNEKLLIIFSPLINTYPLTIEELKELKLNLRELVKNHKLVKDKSYYPLNVYYSK